MTITQREVTTVADERWPRVRVVDGLVWTRVGGAGIIVYWNRYGEKITALMLDAIENGVLAKSDRAAVSA